MGFIFVNWQVEVFIAIGRLLAFAIIRDFGGDRLLIHL